MTSSSVRAPVHHVAAVRMRATSWLYLLVLAIVSAIVFLWPLFVSPDSPLAGKPATTVYFALIIPLLIVAVIVEITNGGLDVRALAMLGVLTAVGAAVRPLGAGTAGFESVFFVLILGGRVFGPAFGFLLGSTVLFTSALLTGGVGPWLPYQMLAASWVGFGAGLLPPTRGKAEIATLIAYGAVSALGYGAVMNMSFWPFVIGLDTDVSMVPGAPVLDNLHRFIIFCLTTSLGWDLGRAFFTGVLLPSQALHSLLLYGGPPDARPLIGRHSFILR